MAKRSAARQPVEITPDLIALIQTMVDAHAALYDAQGAVETALGFLVENISDCYDVISHQVGETISPENVAGIVDAMIEQAEDSE